MINGIVNVYKEKGYTSFDVVAKMRGIFHQKRIGHTGTLDPDAEGVLPVCLGKATKVCDLLTDKDKEYKAVLLLGQATDTQDISGEVINSASVDVTEDEVTAVINSFVGRQLQVPPMYSALKVNGKKLYELAREGKEIERKARPIVVHEIEILSENMPEFTIRVKCSKGTYIRTICHDIGQKLSCGGAMVSLKRTKVVNFGIEDSYTLSRIEDMAKEGRLCEILLPVEKVFEKLPEIRVKEETMKALLNGNQLRREDFLSLSEEALKAEEVRVYGSDGRFYGVYGYQEGRKLFCPIKMFFPEQAER